MGTIISATAVSTDPAVHSSIEHASLAAGDCLDRAGITADQVDLMVNTGVYRDANMSEPAMAAMIQKNVGVNLDYLQNPTAKPAFSFDLMNGACGVLNAVQVGAGFVESGSAEYVLVVSGDAHPSNDPAEARRTGFPYATMGAAMLLGRTWTKERASARSTRRPRTRGRLGPEGTPRPAGWAARAAVRSPSGRTATIRTVLPRSPLTPPGRAPRPRASTCTRPCWSPPSRPRLSQPRSRPGSASARTRR
ncbi:beta-ketoacyl-[acyl-carrier-protein] synthase family protein [Allosalinactinospora lopnorensis]|uniref:hypothetical protein n=1 Tax=Allosalinactinospora lopnorensis TaxID=1352348 RepID=UPI00069707A2|nr:hypothetical protein [Allosalinactinospora lopnorensis]